MFKYYFKNEYLGTQNHLKRFIILIIILMLNDFDKIFRYCDAVYSQSRSLYIEVTQH